MKNRTKAIIIVSLALGATLSLAACTVGASPYEGYSREEGGIVNIIYHANGGSFGSRDGVEIVDSYPIGIVSREGGVRLLAPGDPARNSGSTGTTTSASSVLSRQEYTQIGWYTQCEYGVRVDEATQEPVDEDGNLCSASGNEPGNVYAGKWDFKSDKLMRDMCTEILDEDGDPTGIWEFHLYAAWAPVFSYDFYREASDEEKREAAMRGETIGDWIEYATSAVEDASNRITIPAWNEETGALDMGTSFSSFTDASNRVYTLSAVYADSEKSVRYVSYDDGNDFNADVINENGQYDPEKGTAYLSHNGRVDEERGLAYDTRIRLYTTWREGQWFRISKAEQIVSRHPLNGCYDILEDLDFTNLAWPFGNATSIDSSNMFRGKFLGNGNVIRGIVTTQSSTDQIYSGGVFAALAETAEIRDVTFEDVRYNLTAGTTRTGGSYGLFAGMLNERATVEDVTVSGVFTIGGGMGNFYLWNTPAGMELNRTTEDGTEIFRYGLGLISGNGVNKGISSANISVARDYMDSGERNDDADHTPKLAYTFEVWADDEDVVHLRVLPKDEYVFKPAE